VHIRVGPRYLIYLFNYPGDRILPVSSGLYLGQPTDIVTKKGDVAQFRRTIYAEACFTMKQVLSNK
jgi:hypothetical protein